MMKLKFRYNGEIHEIGLGNIKPLGKSLAIRYGGQIYYASLILAKSDMSSAVKISLGGEIFSLAQEPIYFTPDSEYSCEVPNTDDVFKLSGLNTNLGMLLIDEGYIKTLDGRVVGTFENGVITLFDEALPYTAGVVGLTEGDYELVIAEKEVTPGAFTDIGEETIEYTTSKTADRYEAVGNNTYQYFAGSGGEKAFQITGLSSIITAENADDFISVNDATGKMIINASPSAITLTANQLNYKVHIAEGVSGLNFTGSSGNDTVSVSGVDITINGGAGNDMFKFGDYASSVIKFSPGSDSVNYSTYFNADLTVDFGAGAYDDVTLVGDDVVFTQGTDSLTILYGRGYPFTVVQENGTESTVNFTRYDVKNMLTYDGARKTAVTINGSAAVAKGKPLYTGTLIKSTDYAGTVVTVTADAGANNGNGIYIIGNTKNNVIISNNVTDSTKSGNTLDGGRGNDTLYGSAGKDLFIFRAGNDSTYIVNCNLTRDTVQIYGADGDIVPSFYNNDFQLRVGSYSLYLKDTPSSNTLLLENIIDENEDEIESLCGYTIDKTKGTISKDGYVKIISYVSTYTFDGTEKTLDLSTNYASTLDISASSDEILITDYRPTYKLTATDITSENIYSCSYDDGTIKLGLSNDGTKVDKTVTLICKEGYLSNQLNINTETVYIGNNALYNSSQGYAYNVILTPAFTGTFNALTDSNLRQNSITIDASRTTGVTLVGGEYGNTLIGCSGNDVMAGAQELKDVFVYSGGIDRITNYTEGLDIIQLEAEVDFSEIEMDEESSGFDYSPVDFSDFEFDNEGTITIGSALTGNMLIIDHAANTALTFEMNGQQEILVYSPDGRLNSTKTDITLKSGHGDFNLATSTVSAYAEIASIYAANAANGAVITSNKNVPSYIAAGKQSLTLVGGSENDTIRDGMGSCSIVSGGGSGVFIAGGGHDTIANYTSGNQIKLLLFDMLNAKSFKYTSEGLQITFVFGTAEHTLDLQGVKAGDVVNIDGENYTFDEEKQMAVSENGVAFCFQPNLNVTLNSGDYVGVASLFLQNGGTITGALSPYVTDDGTTVSKSNVFGGNNVSLVAGNSHDTLVYGGGNVRVTKYGVGGNDKISIASDYQLFDVNGRTLIIGSAYTNETVGTLTVETETLNSVRVINGRNGERTVDFTGSAANNALGLFNNTSITGATGVILKTQCGDFGVIGSADNTTATSGGEYYANLYTVEASRCNSFLVGGAKANRIVAKGGTKNVLTGGLGCDTFVFNTGGGVIRDFGINATKDGFAKILAKESSQGSTSTYAAFDRKDPTSYYTATDSLQVKGKVVEIAFDRYNHSETNMNPHNVFTAYVTYISDFNGEAYTIALDNIVKKPTKTHTTNVATQKFQLDTVAAKTLSIYEVDAKGEATKLTATELASMFRSSNPADANKLRYTAYRANIDALATFISDRSKVAITDDPPTAKNTNYQKAYEAEFDRIRAVYAAGGVTNDTTIPAA